MTRVSSRQRLNDDVGRVGDVAVCGGGGGAGNGSRAGGVRAAAAAAGHAPADT